MKADITLFGKFSVIIDGKDLTELLAGSKKKVDLISYLILNHKKNVSPYDMFDALWPGNDSGNPESSLKTHIGNLRGKLRQASSHDYVEAVWGIGFRLKTES